MEAQSFDCGHVKLFFLVVRDLRASMEPQSFDCGHVSKIENGRHPRRGFNGAAVFRLRTPKLAKAHPTAISSFNGAAVFRLRTQNASIVNPLPTFSFNGAAVFRLRTHVKRKHYLRYLFR